MDCAFQEEEPDDWCYFINDDEDGRAVPRSTATVTYRWASGVNTVWKIGLHYNNIETVLQ